MKPFTVEITKRSATFTFFAPVPGAEYLQPTEQFRIPIKDWRALTANGGPADDTATFFNFTPTQLAAHGVRTNEPK